jgi:RNA 2',3'-cyclic 3'-phosphodiesterase
MRLFVAVGLPDDVRDLAEEIAGQIRSRMPHGVRARWVSPANLHLTVTFIGHVSEERAVDMLRALEPPLALAPFDVELKGCGVFPRSGPPRVIWIGLHEGVASLRAMHEEFNRRLVPLGFKPEAREFSVHLTLARIPEIRGAAGRSLRDVVAAARTPAVKWCVSAATAYESLLSPKGPTYRRLFDIRCNG